MKARTLKKMTLALGSLALLGAVTEASALPTFTFQPGAVKPGDTVMGGLMANRFVGSSSELLTPTSATTFTGSGLLTLDTINLDANSVYSPQFSGGFKMYITFTISDTLTGGTFGQPGSTYNINSLDFRVFIDPMGNDSFSTASATTTPGTAPVASNTGDDMLLGFGSLLGGSASLISGGGSTGAGLNSSESFSLCTGAGSAKLGGTTSVDARAAECSSAIGTSFFTAPVPFYNIAFDEFNNTTVQTNAAGQIALFGGSGSINFAIPEPDSIALFGIAALGMGLSLRRRKSVA